jgi:hypothetical protein
LTWNPNINLLTSYGNFQSNRIAATTGGGASTPVFFWTADTNTGIWFPTTDKISLSTGGTDRITADASGLVGINNVNPSYRLDIATGARVNNEIGIRLINTSSEGFYFVPYVSFAAAYTNNSVAGDVVMSTSSTNNLTIGAGGSNAGFRFIQSTNTTTTQGNLYLINSSTRLGYDTGAGGTVNQGAGSGKATGVTLNRPTGQIVMNGAALAANTTVTFVLTNSVIAATDIIVLQHTSVATNGAYNLNAFPAAGSATIAVRNTTAGSLSEAIVLSFAVIRSVTS